ncbi:MAG: RraA family protein [Gaiellaceae bacterium]
MIEDPPQLTVHPRPHRPEATVVDAFRGAQTGHVVDAMDGRGALGGTIKPVPGTPDELAAVVGIALTCWTGPDDNLAIIGAIAEATPGDIVVASTDAFRGSAVAGDMVAGMLRNQGVAALVMDGMARDSAGIHAVGLPFFCAGITPNSCARNGPGTVGAPVTLAGVSVSSGDIVVGDRDGVVIVPLERADAVAARLEEIRTLEGALEAQIEAGLGVPEFYKELVETGAVRRLD